MKKQQSTNAANQRTNHNFSTGIGGRTAPMGTTKQKNAKGKKPSNSEVKKKDSNNNTSVSKHVGLKSRRKNTTAGALPNVSPTVVGYNRRDYHHGSIKSALQEASLKAQRCSKRQEQDDDLNGKPQSTKQRNCDDGDMEDEERDVGLGGMPTKESSHRRGPNFVGNGLRDETGKAWKYFDDDNDESDEEPERSDDENVEEDHHMVGESNKDNIDEEEQDDDDEDDEGCRDDGNDDDYNKGRRSQERGGIATIRNDGHRHHPAGMIVRQRRNENYESPSTLSRSIHVTEERNAERNNVPHQRSSFIRNFPLKLY